MSYRPDDDTTTPESRGERRHSVASGSNGPSPWLIAFGALAVVVVVFIIANDHATEISFGLFRWTTTVRWSIFIAIALGVLLDRLLIFGMQRRRRNKEQARRKEAE